MVPPPASSVSIIAGWWAALRPGQWAKNLLVAVPAVAAHRVLEPGVALHLALAVACFCAMASAVYLVNDVHDAASDRQHPTKRQRPVAAGRIGSGAALTVAAILALTAVAVAGAALPLRFLATLTAYGMIASAYTAQLKRMVGVDVMALALLYTLRLVAGGAAVDVPLSFWLLAFSGFLFFSLALVKRYSELVLALANSRDDLPGRGYAVADMALLSSAGIASGYVSVLVLALYVNADVVAALYRRPEWIGLMCPLLLLWITRIWWLAHRGGLPDDPVAFALGDRASWAIAVAVLGILLAAI